MTDRSILASSPRHATGIESVPRVSQKNEQRCVRCGRWFNAWDERRTTCRLCEPKERTR
jgi:ribosomal protein L37E